MGACGKAQDDAGAAPAGAARRRVAPATMSIAALLQAIQACQTLQALHDLYARVFAGDALSVDTLGRVPTNLPARRFYELSECGFSGWLVASALLGATRGRQFNVAGDADTNIHGEFQHPGVGPDRINRQMLRPGHGTINAIVGYMGEGTLARFVTSGAGGHTFSIVRSGGEYTLLQGNVDAYTLSGHIGKPGVHGAPPQLGVQRIGDAIALTALFGGITTAGAVGNQARTALFGNSLPVTGTNYRVTIIQVE